MIPNELKQLKQWCIWRYAKRNGKWTKIPIDPDTNQFAKSNDESTWADLNTAREGYQKFNADGLGFFFKAPYMGIDIDDVASEIERFKKGDIQDNIISEFYESLKSYAEISPSGNGIHIIAKGSIPGDKRRHGNVEMYDSGRFFTMTGDSLGKYTDINEPSKEALKTLHRKYIGASSADKLNNFNNNVVNLPINNHGINNNLSESEIISQILNSKQADLFKRFMNNEWQELYSSQSEADLAFSNLLAFWCARDFSKMDSLFRQSSLMRDKWDEKRGKTTYGEATLNKAINDTSEVFTPKNEKQPLKYQFNFAKSQQKEFPPRSYDDTGNAQRFIDRYGDIVRYSYNRDKFYIYNDTYWEIDERGLIRNLIDQMIEDMKNETPVVADDVDEDEAIKLLRKHIKNSRSNAAKKRIQDEIKHHVPVVFEDFNPDNMLLNTPSGYIDLSSGEEYPSDKNKMFSYVTNSETTYSQTPDVWLDFLDDIFDHDQELIEFIQRAVGYSLTGSTREQVMFILHGKGRNGKSIFIETIRDIVGSYSDNIQAKTLMVKRGDSINNDVAKLQGVRMVTSSEPNEGFRFDEGLIKQLTGGDTVTARFLFAEEFNFNAKFKIWVTTNHKPIVRGSDDGIWRRLLLIPFKVQIPEEKVDKDLKYKLMREAPAILNWAVEGCIKWQKDGLKIPKAVTDASKGYREEMDVILQFIHEECFYEKGSRTKSSDLYKAYKKWADDTGSPKMSLRVFGEKMKEKIKHKKSSSVIYLDIRLKEKYPGLSKF